MAEVPELTRYGSQKKLEILSEIHSPWELLSYRLFCIHLGSCGCFGYELLDRAASLMDVLLAEEALSTSGCFNQLLW